MFSLFRKAVRLSAYMLTVRTSSTLTSRARVSKRRSLEQELVHLRSLMIGLAGTDEEGVYRPEFVARTLEAAREIPTHTFTDPTTFLQQLRSV